MDGRMDGWMDGDKATLHTEISGKEKNLWDIH